MMMPPDAKRPGRGFPGRSDDLTATFDRSPCYTPREVCPMACPGERCPWKCPVPLSVALFEVVDELAVAP